MSTRDTHEITFSDDDYWPYSLQGRTITVKALPKAFKKKLVKKLRQLDEEGKQTTGMLRRADGECCVLGAAYLANGIGKDHITGMTLSPHFDAPKRAGKLPALTYKVGEVPESLWDTFMIMNDGYDWTFAEFADLIEECL